MSPSLLCTVSEGVAKWILTKPGGGHLVIHIIGLKICKPFVLKK